MSNEKKQESCRQPIGVFDSGMGGISVLRELVKVMPHEDFIYFGDSVNAPYGTRPTEQIRDLTIHHVESLMVKSRRFWSSSRVPSSTIGLRESRL